MSDWFHALGLSFQYFTRIPLPFSFRYNDSTNKKSIFFFPLIGWVIGTIMYYLFQVLHQFLPSSLTAILLVTYLLIITGGLHADGWMDLADGLGSGRKKERMLEIMKDSRVGAMGVIAFVILFSIKSLSLYELLESKYTIEMFILTPIIARWAVLFAIAIFPYARESGLGKDFKLYLKAPVLLMSVMWLIPLYFLSSSFLLMIMLAIIFTLVSGLYFTRVLAGLTGDTYGWLIEGNEALIWLSLVALMG